MDRRPLADLDVRRWLLDAYVVLLVVLLLWPLLTGRGYPVARDMVFTPQVPFRPEAVGMGSGSPRAVPLDAVMATLTTVLDGGVLAKVLIPAALLLAGWGAHRLLPDAPLPARMTMAGLAVWNPFVIERLGLGQWALLFGYAAVVHLARVAQSTGPAGARPGTLAGWLGLGALTPTGAIVAAGSALVLLIRRGQVRTVVLLAILIQLPWVVPGLLSDASATSDPGGVAAFAARAERPGGAVWSLVGLGGIWDGLSVPGSRTGLLGHLTSAVVIVVLLAAWRKGKISARMWSLGLGSLVLGAGSTVPGGAALMEWAVSAVPGAGLLRDAQKWLIPFVVLVVMSSGVAVDRLVRWLRRRAPAVAPAAAAVGLLTPLLLLPDGAVVVHQVVRPVAYPADYAEVAVRVEGTEGTLVSLPWQLYQQYEWSGPYAAYDPSSRWFDTPVVTNDDLVLGDRLIRGEDPVAATIGPAASTADLSGLRDAGVRFVLVHRDAAGGHDIEPAPRDVAYDGPDLLLLDVGGDPGPGDVGPWSLRAKSVLAVDLAVAVVLVGLAGVEVVARRRRSATLR